MINKLHKIYFTKDELKELRNKESLIMYTIKYLEGGDIAEHVFWELPNFTGIHLFKSGINNWNVHFSEGIFKKIIESCLDNN